MENRIKSLIKKLSRLGFHVKPKGDNKQIDPVCGMKASLNLFKADYKDKSYYFCSNHCQQQFEEKPEAYITK